mgnify:CR=1 FL=1
MTDIDYTQFKIVGVVEAQPNTKHAIINAVGYLSLGLKVFSTTAPVITFLIFVLTKAAPLPGFTCWNSMIDTT